MSINTVKGNNLEAQVSRSLRNHWLPILVSSKVLRQNLSGQIDVSYLDLQKKRIVVVECKSSLFASKRQQMRLKKSARFLSEVLRENVIIEYFVKNFLPNA